MPAADLLSKLAKVKPTGRARWMACCPAHADDSPSLSVRELDDGRVLVYCFAGCAVADVLGAVGLEFDALFPASWELGANSAAPRRRWVSGMDAIKALAAEATIVATVAARLGRGEALGDDERARVMAASARINAAVDLAE